LNLISDAGAVLYSTKFVFPTQLGRSVPKGWFDQAGNQVKTSDSSTQILNQIALSKKSFIDLALPFYSGLSKARVYDANKKLVLEINLKY
ncbi:hypothetical protein HY993_04920, partial [Candidatus Micrarchaeota archaeon]|nr:hypothetical protein [Candidatus Micrarchaeota archaeon]